MILVDSSVWIDYFNGAVSSETDLLDGLLGRSPVVIGDLILAEVLQGFRSDTGVRKARTLLATLDCHVIGGCGIAAGAADNFRRLRARGITIRKSVDMLIGTWCIAQGCELLHADRDFDPMEIHLGLRVLRAQSQP